MSIEINSNGLNSYVGTHAIEIGTRSPMVSRSKSKAWAETTAREREGFAKRRGFREGTNRAKIYAALTRAGGASVEQCRAECHRPNRSLASMKTDLDDIARITERPLDSEVRDGTRFYWLGK